MLKLVLAILIVFAAQETAQISAVVHDENDQPVNNAVLVLHSDATTARTSTDELGKFRFDSVAPGSYTLEFNRTGFFKLADDALDAKPGTNEIMVTLNHETEVRSNLDVLSSPHETDAAGWCLRILRNTIRDSLSALWTHVSLLSVCLTASACRLTSR